VAGAIQSTEFWFQSLVAWSLLTFHFVGGEECRKVAKGRQNG